MEGYSAQQACHYTQCTPHQLRYWDKTRLVQPSIRSTGGRPGVPRRYSFRDLVQLKLIKSLLGRGVSLQTVRAAYDQLRRRGDLDGRLSSTKLMTDGKTIYEIDEAGRTSDLLKEGQLVFARVIGQAAVKVDGSAAGLFNRDRFVEAIRRVERELEADLGGR